MAVPETQKREGGEVRARGLSSDREPLRAKLRPRPIDEPESRSLTVVRARRERVLGRQPVADTDHGHAARGRECL